MILIIKKALLQLWETCTFISLSFYDEVDIVLHMKKIFKSSSCRVLAIIQP